MPCIVLTGGGTAGHVMPNLALLPSLRRSFDRIHYIGSVGGVEEALVKKAGGVEYHAIPCTKLVRSLHPKNLLIPFKLHQSIRAAKQLLLQLQPDVIFSKGGYVALPVCLAAKHIPLVVHESDQNLGLSNRLALRHCDTLCTSFALSDPPEKSVTVHTGAPLRAELYRGDAAAARRQYPFSSPRPTLLITGGSQGAVAINRAVFESLTELTARFNVLHLVGPKNTDGRTAAGYHQIGFTDRMADILAAADYVVTRGGANTLFELIALKKPALVIPLPLSISRGDQIENAEYFRKCGMLRVLPQAELTGQSLLTNLTALKDDAARLITNMSEAQNIDGTAKICQILKNYAK